MSSFINVIENWLAIRTHAEILLSWCIGLTIGWLTMSGVHEFGHVRAARRCGFDVDAVRVGWEGQRSLLKTFKVRRTHVTVSWPPLTGVVIPGQVAHHSEMMSPTIPK
jgi:hypothetical protein